MINKIILMILLAISFLTGCEDCNPCVKPEIDTYPKEVHIYRTSDMKIIMRFKTYKDSCDGFWMSEGGVRFRVDDPKVDYKIRYIYTGNNIVVCEDK